MKKRWMLFLFVLIGVFVIGCSEKNRMIDDVCVIDDTGVSNEVSTENKNDINNEEKSENIDLVGSNDKGEMIPYEQNEVEINLETMDLMDFLYNNEEWIIQPTVTVRNATFYRPLTVEEATVLKLDYDGVMVVNGVRYITYDWVEGDDGMQEEYEDSLMTAESYAEIFGLSVANIEELTVLIEEETAGLLEEDEMVTFGWPMTFWTSDKAEDGEGEDNPIQFDMTKFYEGNFKEEGETSLNLPVILVSGELYYPDYTGTRDIKEKVIDDDGTGYLEVRLFDTMNEKEGWVTIKVNQDTKIYLVNGDLGSMEDVTASQEGMNVIMDDNREYAKEIYLTPFDAF